MIISAHEAKSAFRVKNERAGVFASCMHATTKIYFHDKIRLLSTKSTSSIDYIAIGKINGRFSKDFSNTLPEILGSKYPLSLQDIEKDMAMAYGIRNFGAHRIEDQLVLYNNFVELSQRLMNALFFAVEKLYR